MPTLYLYVFSHQYRYRAGSIQHYIKRTLSLICIGSHFSECLCANHADSLPGINLSCQNVIYKTYETHTHHADSLPGINLACRARSHGVRHTNHADSLPGINLACQNAVSSVSLLASLCLLIEESDLVCMSGVRILMSNCGTREIHVPGCQRVTEV